MDTSSFVGLWSGVLVAAQPLNLLLCFVGVVLGTPADVVARLNTEINAVIADPAARAQLVEQAFEPVGGTPEQLGEVIRSGIDRWAEVIKANNIPAVN